METRPEWEWGTLSVAVHSTERAVGGADGRTGWGCLYVSHLWVTSARRGEGIGARIMSVMESTARARGCTGVWLDTFSFQAKPFYESIGYRQFGELADFSPGHVRHFLYKRLEI
ncbi:MAG: GNAT family N-acetyltransferase [Acidimicrobiales bacterium]